MNTADLQLLSSKIASEAQFIVPDRHGGGGIGMKLTSIYGCRTGPSGFRCFFGENHVKTHAQYRRKKIIDFY